jgi:hypothetical protein
MLVGTDVVSMRIWVLVAVCALLLEVPASAHTSRVALKTLVGDGTASTCETYVGRAACDANNPRCHYCALTTSCHNASQACRTCEEIGVFADKCNEHAFSCNYCFATQRCYSLTSNYTCPMCSAIANRSQCLSPDVWCQWCTAQASGLSYDTCYDPMVPCANIAPPAPPPPVPFWATRTGAIVISAVALFVIMIAVGFGRRHVARVCQRLFSQRKEGAEYAQV